MDIQCLTDQLAVLGESPLWAPDEGAVYWIDIRGHKLLRTTLSGPATQTWNLPSPPGMIAHRRQGGLVIALQDGLYAFEADTGDLRHLMSLEADMPDNRANDGKPDVAGRLWLGTMNADDETIPSGKFYRITPSLDVTAVYMVYVFQMALPGAPTTKPCTARIPLLTWYMRMISMR